MSKSKSYFWEITLSVMGIVFLGVFLTQDRMGTPHPELAALSTLPFVFISCLVCWAGFKWSKLLFRKIKDGLDKLAEGPKVMQKEPED